MNPDVSHYPDSSTCADLSQLPPGELVGSGVSQGIPYGQLVYRWMTLGRPSSWDSDGEDALARTTGPPTRSTLS